MTKLKTKKVTGFNDKTLANLAETAKIEGLAEKLIKMREDLNNGFSQDMVDEGIQKRIADGTIANMTIEDNSISKSKYKNNSISNLKLEDHIITPDKINTSETILKAGYAVDKTNQGEFIAENWYLTDFIPVNENDIIKVNLGRNAWISLWDGDKIFIDAVEAGAEATERTYTVANGIYYVRFNIYKDHVSEFTITINDETVNLYRDMINIPWVEVGNSNIANNSITQNKMNNDAIFAKQGYAVDDQKQGEFAAENWYLTDFIPVVKDDIVKVNLGRNHWISLWNENKEFIASKNVGASSSPRIYNVEANVAYVRFNIYKENIQKIVITKNSQTINTFTERTSLSWLSINEENLSNNILNKINANNNGSWYGKNMIMFGDSIVQDVTNSNGGYVTRLKTNLGLATAINKGISGRPIANGSANGVGTNTTIKSVTDFSDYDLIIIAGGTNDFKLNIPLGTKGVIGDTVFDDTTFYGAYREAIEYILKSKPTARICLWTPLQRDNANYDVNYTNSAGHKLIDYVNAIIKIAEMYAIPVIDLYRNSGVTKLTLSTFTADGLHLNSMGYDYVTMYAAKQINNI